MWQRGFEGDPALVDSWNDAMKGQRMQKAVEAQSIDLRLLAAMPMHNRLTFKRAQVAEEKAAERLCRSAGCACKTRQGWMAEVDRQVAHHDRRGEKQLQSLSSSSSSLSSAVPRNRA
jgi:hypothetical protein